MSDDSPNPDPTIDAILLVSFGGPEGPDDVMPFLQNVVRGRNVPQERLLEVAEHYHHFGGISPINEQCRELIVALEGTLEVQELRLPIYWGNRNWRPFLSDTMQEMTNDGIRHALAIVTSAFGSYSSCRQYLENIEAARSQAGPSAPKVSKLRLFYNHPEFIAASAERVNQAIDLIPAERRDNLKFIFTAHSIPLSMAEGCGYARQLHEASRLVAERTGIKSWRLAYQSRSGPPTQPWLEPDICDVIRTWESPNEHPIVIVPIGFLTDHMEVLYDLDTEARQLCEARGISMIRAGTVGAHPRFVRMLYELIAERLRGDSRRSSIGQFPASPDVCPSECCPAPMRRGEGASDGPRE